MTAVEAMLQRLRVWLPAVERWAARRLPLGPWVPGLINMLLLVVEIGIWLQAASRGMDYVLPSQPGPTPRVLTVVEAAAPLPLWGGGFLLGAALVFAGLSGGWRWVIVVGHAVLGALYIGFASGMLQAGPVYSWWLALGGVAALVPGVWLGITRWRRWDQVRFLLSLAIVGIGGIAAAFGLGSDFRTATGLLIAGTLHAAFAIGLGWTRPPAELGVPR